MVLGVALAAVTAFLLSKLKVSERRERFEKIILFFQKGRFILSIFKG